MSIFKNKKNTESVSEEPVRGDSVQNESVAEEKDTEEKVSESNNQDVLTAEDVKELAPYYENVILALKQVYDPEIPVNIYDLGLIYELNINKAHEVYIKMTFTAPNCPMADEVIENVRINVEDVPGIKKCLIDLVFDPVWDQSMLSDEARLELGLDDIDSMQQSAGNRIDPGDGPDYSKDANS